VAGLALVVVAAHGFATTPREVADLVGIATLFVVVLIAERQARHPDGHQHREKPNRKSPPRAHRN
jgi:hypothetical protein